MRLESFSVENYRSITQARRIPLSSSTVLIGPNNEGKSNILRALSVAMEALRQYRPVAGSTTGAIRNIRSRSFGPQDDKIYDRKRDLPISLQRSKSSKQTKITLEFSLNADEIMEFKEIVKSNLNGTLPVCITFGDGIYDVNIIKPGRGSITLKAKNNRIVSFLADRIQFQYIPAVRTARTAAAVVEDIVANELRDLENDPAFQEALTAIRTLQRPVLEAFSERVTDTLKAFVPGIRAVNFSVNDERRYSALRHSIEITIDDGDITNLDAKGDGIQSLVALGIRRHALEESRAKRTYIFAIEEPEAHLHPNAIHELRIVLDQLSTTDQIVLTTHSGLLVNRSNLASNILVQKSKAAAAKSLSAIRESLGIRSLTTTW
jgi:putative ATP-dependent endonuclease of the OLD family